MSDFQLVIDFVFDNLIYFGAAGLLILIVFIINKWPDIATFTFLKSGIRGGKHVNRYRKDLAENITSLGSRIQTASGEQKLKLQKIKLERERIQQLVRTNPILVKDVGKSLMTIENEYLRNLKSVKSSQAKEILRLTTEKRMNDLLQTLNITSTDIPNFNIDPDD
jgi:hypothetical protein